MSPMPMSFMVSSGRSRIARDRRDHAEARRQRRAHLAGAVDRLGNEAIGLVGPGLDDHVIGFGDADLELVGLDRLHVLPIRGDHRHREARNPDIEIGHGRRIDDAQAHPLAGREQPGPVRGAVMAVDHEMIGRAGDVGDVGRVHPHPGPHAPFGGRLVLAREQAGEGLLLHVEVAALRLQLAQDGYADA